MRNLNSVNFAHYTKRTHGDFGSIAALVELLVNVKNDWLASSFKGGSPPRFIIECCRRPVPRGSGVPIVGICEQDELSTTGQRLAEHLQSLGERYPELVSAVADFRSRIDERIRAVG